ncbi:MAG: hypothetical protein HFI40_10200 [Lachnospiraceae bacterium]|jgi:hypothetical protein|nr:hypothetical protein [Lachnospiraceae bacterium]MCX4315837.1 hypothetical protein [Lachnospiraceae bacterium]
MAGKQTGKQSGKGFPSLDDMNVSSATECTGLMYRPPLDEDELDSYKDLYDLEYSDIDDGV